MDYEAHWKNMPKTEYADLSMREIGHIFLAPPAKHIIELSGVTTAAADKELAVFDCAAGTGIVGAFIYGLKPEYKDHKNMTLLFGDINEAGLEVCKERAEQNGWLNAKTQVVNAMDTKLPDNSFTHILINYGIQLFPDGKAALAEMLRILKPGGILTFSCHKHVGWLEGITVTACKNIGLPPPMGTDVGPLAGWNSDAFIPIIKEIGFVDVRTEPMENLVDVKEHMQEDWFGMFDMSFPLISAMWDETNKKRKEELMVEIEKVVKQERQDKGRVIVRMAGPMFYAKKPE